MNYRYLILLVLWMAIIFCLSSIPYLRIEELGEILNQVSRKSIHIIIYGMLTLLIWYSFPKLDKDLAKKVVMCGFLAILFAIGDEIHQGFVPGRCGDVKGVLFDTIGIFWALIWLRFRISRFAKIPETATK